MAIITTATVKTLLQISGSTYDSLIATLIPIAESMFLKIRGIEFFQIEGDITSGSANIENLSVTDMDKLRLGDRVYNSNIDGKITVIDLDDSWIVTLDTNATGSEDNAEMIVYPRGYEYPLSKIIEYMMNKDSGTGYRSENIGNYSYTKFGKGTGIPLDIANMIERYQSMK